MNTRIYSATVIVKDQDAALDFYVNTLGWEKVYDNEVGPGVRFVSVIPPGAETSLALGTPGWLGGGREPGGETGISLVTPDIAGAYATLSERGVRFKGPVETMPWGDKAAWFYDPDGNEFFLVEG